MKTNRIIGMSILFTAIAFTGCSEFDNGYPIKDIEFQTNFLKEVGTYDTRQDWNLAERAGVTVITSETRNIKVYSENKGIYWEVGDFKGVSGFQKLNVNVEEGVEYLVLNDGEKAVRAKVGGTVSYDGKFSYEGELKQTRAVDTSNKNTWDATIVPGPISTEEKNAITALFNYSGQPDNTKLVPWSDYYIQVLQAVKGSGGNENIFIYNKDGTTQVTLPTGESFSADDVNTFTGHGSLFSGVAHVTDIDPTGVMMHEDQVLQFSFNNQGSVNYRIEIVDDAIYIGFAISNKSNKYNDLILKLTKAKGVEVDPDVLVDVRPAAWILAGEDLGGAFDLDYNDVVIKVVHEGGKQQAEVTPLAAGGTLASYLFFGTQSIGEIHQLLGADEQLSGDYQPINAYGTVSVSTNTIMVDVGGAWDLSLTHSTDNLISGGVNMGDFSIKVCPPGTKPRSARPAIDDPAFGEAATVSAPVITDPPYIICVPYAYARLNYPNVNEKTITVWNWPKELTNIRTAYANFDFWVQDFKQSKDWYRFPENYFTVNTTPLVNASFGTQPQAMTDAEKKAYTETGDDYIIINPAATTTPAP